MKRLDLTSVSPHNAEDNFGILKLCYTCQTLNSPKSYLCKACETELDWIN